MVFPTNNYVPFTEEHNFKSFFVSPFVTVINGYTFGNLPVIEMCQYSNVDLYMFGIGSEPDVHTVSFEGNTMMDRCHRTTTISLFPATLSTSSMVPEVIGTWLLSCLVNEHFQGRTPDLWHLCDCLTLLIGFEELLTWEECVSVGFCCFVLQVFLRAGQADLIKAYQYKYFNGVQSPLDIALTELYSFNIL